MRLPQVPAWWAQNEYFAIQDHFPWYISPHLWTSLAADSGTSVAITANGVGGILALTTGATDNNEAGVITTNAFFKMATGKTIMAEVLLQYAEANTDDANVFFGFSDALAANMLVDDGAGPATSFSGFGIYKVDGGTNWKTVCSKSTTQTITKSTLTPGGTGYVRLGLLFEPTGPGSKGTIRYYIDEQPLLNYDIAGNPEIFDTIDYSSAVAMKFGVYVKAGGATSEVVSVDDIRALQGPVTA